MHTLIVGPRHVGKSTLIRRVLEEIRRPVFGFETKKEDSLETEDKGSPVYIYDAGNERIRSEENLVGHCKNKCFETRVDTFDRFSAKLLQPVPEGHIVLLDEIGFMETKSEAFCAAILHLLDGDAPVIAAVKNKDFPFLDAVRNHPNCKCFCIDEDNRDALFPEVLAFVKEQLGEA